MWHLRYSQPTPFLNFVPLMKKKYRKSNKSSLDFCPVEKPRSLNKEAIQRHLTTSKLTALEGRMDYGEPSIEGKEEHAEARN